MERYLDPDNFIDLKAFKKREYMVEKMHEYKEEAFKQLSRIVPGECIEDISEVLIYSWLEELPAARRLAQNLGLELIEISAMSENYADFADLLEKKEENDWVTSYVENF